MSGMQDDRVDRKIEELLEAYRGSPLRASARALAESGECPRPAEIAALERGAIAEPWRRESLARHLVDCPSCLNVSLRVLSGEPIAGTHGRRSSVRTWKYSGGLGRGVSTDAANGYVHCGNARISSSSELPHRGQNVAITGSTGCSHRVGSSSPDSTSVSASAMTLIIRGTPPL